MKKVIIIGAGFGGLSTAAFLSKYGFDVTVLEKNSQVGGRASTYIEKGFLFDKGPSWYLMPEIFERFFKNFNKNFFDYYKLVKLDPNYRLFFEDGQVIDVPSNIESVKDIFESFEKGSSRKLEEYINNSTYQYNLIDKFLYRKYESIKDIIDLKLLTDGIKLNIFNYMDGYVKRFFKNKKLRQILEYTTVFLGSSPYNTPAFYSIMSHVDFKSGVYYPFEGFSKVAQAYAEVAKDFGCKILLNKEVKKIVVKNGIAKGVETNDGFFDSDVVVSNADFYFTENSLLEPLYKSFDKKYWNRKILGPSAFLIFLGIKKKIEKLKHHNLYLVDDWENHFKTIFDIQKMPENPSFYISATSKTDKTTAPEGCENLFVLVPIASGIEDNDSLREQFFELIVEKISRLVGFDLKENILVKKIYSINDFVEDYNSYKGNALGLSHAKFQTAIFRLPYKSKRVNNLFFVGHYTHPGIGVPMVTIAGEVLSKCIKEKYD